MIPERLACLCLLSTAWAQTPPPAGEPRPDTSIERHRTAFEALTERAIGRTSRRLRYDWRRDTVQVGLSGGLPAELNNFDSLRAGVFARFPVAGLLLGVATSYVWVYGSESTRTLALTPYRQPGRPDRVEVDLSLAYPLAEGVVTAAPRLLPSAQIVLHAVGDLRYLYYPGALHGVGLQDTLTSLLSASLTGAERDNLEPDRPPGMKIDAARYGLLAGLSVDLYFGSGLFFSHQALVTVPLLNGATDSELGFGLELDLATGLSF